MKVINKILAAVFVFSFGCLFSHDLSPMTIFKDFYRNYVWRGGELPSLYQLKDYHQKLSEQNPSESLKKDATKAADVAGRSGHFELYEEVAEIFTELVKMNYESAYEPAKLAALAMYMTHEARLCGLGFVLFYNLLEKDYINTWPTAMAVASSLEKSLNSSVMDLYAIILFFKLKVAPGDFVSRENSNYVDTELRRPQNCQSPEFVRAIVELAKTAVASADVDTCMAGLRLFTYLINCEYLGALSAAKDAAAAATRSRNCFVVNWGENLENTIQLYKRRHPQQ